VLGAWGGRLVHVYRLAKTQYIHDLTDSQRETMEVSLNWSWPSGTSISTR
jgi:hypothetical protein